MVALHDAKPPRARLRCEIGLVAPARSCDPSVRVLDVDLFDRQVIEDPYPLYAALRAHGEPVRSADGHWILCRYDDVRQALVDHGRFSSAETNGATRRRLPVLVGTDPPEHTRLRRLTSKHLVSDTAQTCEPQIERRIEALVAETL